MTKAHPHRQVNVHLDTIDDADVIERIEAQPSMVGYVRELVRRDIHGEQLDCMVLKTSELQAENAKLRESLENAAGIIADICGECPVSRYEWLSGDGCAEKCGTVTEEECWIAYLTGKRWDESGAEVDVWAK